MAAVTVYSAPEDGRKGHPKHVVFNKHNTARVASCWFIIYYRLVMHGNSNIKKNIYIYIYPAPTVYHIQSTELLLASTQRTPNLY